MGRRLFGAALVVAAVAAILIASLAGGASGATSPTPTNSIPTEPEEVPPTEAQVHQAALRAAAISGELTPTQVEQTTGTLGQAAQVLDPTGSNTFTDPRTGRPWVESPVYVLTMRGHFTAYGPIPKNHPIPTGTVLTIVLDGKSGRLVAESLNNSVPDLHAINATVTHLGG
jgi:hypothetical protein